MLNWSFFFFFWCLIFNQNQSEVPSENTFENLLNRYTNTVQQFINRWLNNNKYRYIWWLTKWVIQGFCFFFFLANKLWSDTIWSDSLLNLSETNYSSCLQKKKIFSRLNQKKNLYIWIFRNYLNNSEDHLHYPTDLLTKNLISQVWSKKFLLLKNKL